MEGSSGYSAFAYGAYYVCWLPSRRTGRPGSGRRTPEVRRVAWDRDAKPLQVLVPHGDFHASPPRRFGANRFQENFRQYCWCCPGCAMDGHSQSNPPCGAKPHPRRPAPADEPWGTNHNAQQSASRQWPRATGREGATVPSWEWPLRRPWARSASERTGPPLVHAARR